MAADYHVSTMKILFITLFVGFVFFLLLVAWASSSAKRQIAETLKTLANLSCPKCGAAYGTEAASQAHERFVAHACDVRKANPHLRINFGHTWTVHCSHCGAETGFRDDTRTLQTAAT